jgi:hypothetical protein
MGKKETTETTTKERASVSRERRLALALRAVLDSLEGATIPEEKNRVALLTAEEDAITTLNELGYSMLEGIPRRVAKLNQYLTDAVAAGDGKEIARLGLELERAKAGKEPLSVNGTAAKDKGNGH